MSEIIEIPVQQLSSTALEAIIEDWVLQEGTDYGVQEQSFSAKKHQLRGQIERGDVVILYETATDSCSLKNRSHLI